MQGSGFRVQGGSGEVKKIDIESGKIVGKMPLGDDKAKPKDVLLSLDESKLFVAGGRANAIFVLDSSSLEILATVPVGKRTWGGLVGTLGFPELMDGGYVSAPNLAIWTEDGFIVENVGVPPDVEVEQWPAEIINGKDPQLEKAIEIII